MVGRTEHVSKGFDQQLSRLLCAWDDGRELWLHNFGVVLMDASREPLVSLEFPSEEFFDLEWDYYSRKPVRFRDSESREVLLLHAIQSEIWNPAGWPLGRREAFFWKVKMDPLEVRVFARLTVAADNLRISPNGRWVATVRGLCVVRFRLDLDTGAISEEILDGEAPRFSEATVVRVGSTGVVEAVGSVNGRKVLRVWPAQGSGRSFHDVETVPFRKQNPGLARPLRVKSALFDETISLPPIPSSRKNRYRFSPVWNASGANVSAVAHYFADASFSDYANCLGQKFIVERWEIPVFYPGSSLTHACAAKLADSNKDFVLPVELGEMLDRFRGSQTARMDSLNKRT